VKHYQISEGFYSDKSDEEETALAASQFKGETSVVNMGINLPTAATKAKDKKVLVASLKATASIARSMVTTK
jgi:acyl CoA:acetate/3-ketoacid CoA transferase beta subunit